MPTNKIPLIYSAQMEQQQETLGSSNPLNMGKSLVGAGLMAAPMFAAGVYGAKRVTSNEFKQIAGLKTNSLGDASVTVGNNLRRLQEFQNNVRKENAEKFRHSFVHGDDKFLKSLLDGNEASQRRILTGVLDAFRDLGDAGQSVAHLKQNIIDIINQEKINIDDNAKSILRQAFGQVKNASPDFFDRMSRSINFYEPVENMLRAPLEFQGIKSKYNPVSNLRDNFGLAAENRYRKIQGLLNQDRFNIDAVTMTEKVGSLTGTGVYARVTDKSTGRLNLLALDVTDVVQNIGSPVVRTGAGTQAYVAPAAVGNAEFIQQNFLKSGTKFNAMDIQRSLSSTEKVKPFSTFADFQIDLLEKMIKDKGGSDFFRVGDFSSFNAEVASMLENVNRTMDDTSAAQLKKGELGMFTRHSQLKQQAVASKIAFAGLENLNPVDRRNFVASVISGSGQEILTGHGNLQVTTMNNLSFVNANLRDGTTLDFSGSYLRGMRPTSSFRARGVESEIMLSGVNHAILPVTARPKQFFNLDNYFVKPDGAGGFTTLNKREDRALMLLDMKEGRLGVSEGEMYLSRGRNLTRKSFPKTVLNPRAMGTSSNDLLNELIRRSNAKEGMLVIEHGSSFRMGKEFVQIGEQRMSKTTQYFDTIGDFFRAYGTNQTGGLLLGTLDKKQIEVPFFRGTRRVGLEIADNTVGSGTDLLKIAGFADLEDDFPKIFAEHTKATAKGLDHSGIGRLSTRYQKEGINFGNISIFGTDEQGMSAAMSKDGKVIARSIGAAEGNMLKKGVYYHALQMASATEAIAQARGLDGEMVFREIDASAERFRASKGFNKMNVQQQQKAYAQSFVSSISDFFVSQRFQKAGGDVTASELGRVFGGFYSVFEPGAKESKTFSSMTRADVESIIENKFKSRGTGFINTTKDEIRQGLAIALTNLRAGPDLATYRANTASMEARLFNFLGMKLSQVGGLSADETANFLFGIMSRKTEAGNELVALREYLNFHEFAKGQESVFDANKFKNMERVSLDEFTKAGQDPEKLKQFLRSREGGFLLDFGSDTSASKALKNVFGSRGNLYIPAGERFMESIASQGTEMIKSQGAVALPGEYLRNMQHFAENLSAFMNPAQMTAENTQMATSQVRSFQNKFAEISGNAFKNILKGKLQGSASLRSAGISLGGMTGDKYSGMVRLAEDGIDAKALATSGTSVAATKRDGIELDNATKKRMKELVNISMSKKAGQATFVDTQGFLATMSDFIEGAKKEYTGVNLANVDVSLKHGAEFRKMKNVTASGAKKLATRDAGFKFQHFFLGSYEDYAKNVNMDSLTGVVSRHPILGPGHVQTTSLHRYTPDAGAGLRADQFLINFNESKGKGASLKIRQAFGDDVFQKNNYETLSRRVAEATKAPGGLNLQQKKALSGYFQTMAENITSFQQGEGGGRIFFPDMEVDVHYGQDKVKRLNLSIASAAIGDMDGDLFQLIMPSQKGAKTIAERLTGKNARQAMVDEMMYRSSLSMIFDEANEGIKNLSKSLGEPESADQFLKGKLMQEVMGKEVGLIDVSLDNIRMGMVNMEFSQKELRHVHSGLALLTTLEEVGTIKAKKLPQAIELGKLITHAANKMYEGDSTYMRNVVKNVIFKGTDLESGFKLKGLDLSGISDKKTREMIETSFKKFQGSVFDLDKIFELFDRAAVVSREKLGSAYTKTVRGTSSVLTNEKQSRQKLSGYMAATTSSHQARMAGASNDSVYKQSAGVLSEIYSKTSKASSVFNSKMLGPAIAGIGGTLALMGALGSLGHSPEPLLMPGEITDRALGQKMAQGQLFDSRGAATEASNYTREENRINMNERVINVGETRVSRGGSYMMNGELPNRDSIGLVQNFLNAMGGSGNFMINDSRGPVTMNFMNKIMGD